VSSESCVWIKLGKIDIKLICRMVIIIVHVCLMILVKSKLSYN